MNAGIQGLAADIFKVALVRLDRALERGGFASRLILQVHDEVLVEVAAGEHDAPSSSPAIALLRRRRPAGAARGQPLLRRHLGRRQGLKAAAHERRRAAALVRADRRPPRRGVPALLLHQGHRAGGRLPRRAARRCSQACACSTSAAGRDATPTSWPGAGIAAHGIDISQRFVELAVAGAPPRATFERLDARALPFDGEFDAVISLCQGGFGLVLRRRATTLDRAARAWRGRPGPAAGWPSPRSTPTSRSATTTDAAFDADAGVAHERTEVRNEAGEVVEVDLWTAATRRASCACSPAAAGLVVDAICAVEPGRLRGDAARRRAPRAPAARYPPSLSVGAVRRVMARSSAPTPEGALMA